MSTQIDYILVLLGTVVILATAVTFAIYIALSTKRELDIRKRAEETLLKSHEQIRNLSIHLLSVREEERTKIAREIHDRLGQMLTAIKMDLFWLNKRLQYLKNNVLTEKVISTINLVDNTLQTVKQISAQLRPAILDDQGLVAALAWEVEEFKKRLEIECRLKTSPENIDIDSDRATVIYRITQEVLTNVARHAQASKVEVNLSYDSGYIFLEVGDNGVGITEDQQLSPKSFGLLGIRERALQYGGELDICGVKGKGTIIKVTLPKIGSVKKS